MTADRPPTAAELFTLAAEVYTPAGVHIVASGYDVEGRIEHQRAVHIARHDPARVLREVAAKRAIIDAVYSPETMTLLASVYADHPDFRAEWGVW